MSIFGLKSVRFAGITGAFALAVLLPVFAFGGAQTLYVDDGASGTENGTKEHPYKKIGTALKHADTGTEIRIKNGTYKENIEIPKDVRVAGDSGDRSDVVIDGDNRKPTVEMKHKAELSSVTVKDGRHGIRVLGDAKAHIYDVLVKDAERDGIHIDAAPRDKKHRAFIDDVEVKHNGKAGVYSEKRLTVIVGSKIHGNDGDGIDFRPGIEAWLEGNKIYENKGSGWKVVLDGSEIWTKKNDFRKNDREGVQIESFGVAGKFGVKKSKSVGNDRYGIALVARNEKALDMWKGVFLEDNSVFENTLGQVSKVILVKETL